MSKLFDYGQGENSPHSDISPDGPWFLRARRQMTRMKTPGVVRRSTLAFILLLAASVSVLVAQNPQPQTDIGSRSLSAELLRLPLPQDEDRAYWDSLPHFIHPERKTPERPPDSATLYVLAEYWSGQFSQNPEKLSDALRLPLLEACEAFPEHAAELAHLVPRTPEANSRLLALLDHLPDEGEGDPRRLLIRYLGQNSESFRPELIARVRAAHEGEGYVENEEDVRALARLDWDRAGALLPGMIKPDRPRMTALAVDLQYRHAVQSSSRDALALRGSLKAIAVDKSAPAKARDIAIQSLMETNWPGRDEWFISLFHDGTLTSTSDGVFLFNPLEDPVHHDPSRWIPSVAAFVGDPDPNVHLNAVSILASFQGEEACPDAAIPLLPWLFDPKWANPQTSSHWRSTYVYTLSKLTIPESVPGLLHLLQHPEDAERFELEYAAEAVVQYRDERTAPVLRQLLMRDVEEEDERLAAAKALLASGTVSLEEKVQAVAALARQVGTRGGREQMNNAESHGNGNVLQRNVVLGRAVIETEGKQAILTDALGQHSRQIRSQDPGTADTLDAILSVLPNAQRDLKLIMSIINGSIEAMDVRDAIDRRAWLAQSNGDQLRALAKGEGSAAAIATVLLGDTEWEFEILSGRDVQAQATLLASLRLSGDMAPEDAVRRLTTSPEPELPDAANTYWELLWKWRHTL